ncbi:MAG: methionyl-tRNA formyltransferase [Bacteroidia bacterium]|nr:methionyl-tRNA formyltransferase [Bacteroidia bacterium]
MGTPEFAVQSLRKLLEEGKNVVAVVTVPDKPAGRGKKLTASAVKVYAESQNLPVLQPKKLRDPDFNQALKDLEPDIMVVVAFRMLPEMVWSLPNIGTFNLHASLLPDYRGAAPINWAIINGEKESGVTTFFIDKQIDTGNLLLQEKVQVPDNWTAGDLHDKLMEIGAELVVKTVHRLEAGDISPKAQDNSLFKNHAPKIFKEDCLIDWTQPRNKVYDFIRGLSPYPGAYTFWNDKMVKVFSAEIGADSQTPPGTVLVDKEDSTLNVACADGWLSLRIIQLQGKKRVSIEDFLRGFRGELTLLGKKKNSSL